MSQHYEMQIFVEDISTEESDRLYLALLREWNIEDSWAEGTGFSFQGSGNLTGGESEESFSKRVTRVIWDKLNRFVPVTVRATYLDAPPPSEWYSFAPSDLGMYKGG